jgi:hypothetical protein
MHPTIGRADNITFDNKSHQESACAQNCLCFNEADSYAAHQGSRELHGYIDAAPSRDRMASRSLRHPITWMPDLRT